MLSGSPPSALTVPAVWFTLFTMSEQRDRILLRACELYLSDGLEGFSMRKLAKQVGVTAPALYRHYDGREAVLADVVREGYRTFMRYIYRALGAPTPLDRFFGAADGYLDFVFDHPRWYSILFTGPEHLGMEALPEDIETMHGAGRCPYQRGRSALGLRLTSHILESGHGSRPGSGRVPARGSRSMLPSRAGSQSCQSRWLDRYILDTHRG